MVDTICIEMNLNDEELLGTPLFARFYGLTMEADKALDSLSKM